MPTQPETKHPNMVIVHDADEPDYRLPVGMVIPGIQVDAMLQHDCFVVGTILRRSSQGITFTVVRNKKGRLELMHTSDYQRMQQGKQPRRKYQRSDRPAVAAG